MVVNQNQVVSIDIVVYNNSTKVATGIVTKLTLSQGLEYVSYILPNGSFNPQTLEWVLFQLQPNTAKQLTLKVKIKDIKKSPFYITQKVTANEKDINMSNNCKTIVLNEAVCVDECVPGEPSDPKVFVNDYTFSPISVNLSSFNNVKCGCCTTKYVIYSVDNFVTDYINSQTGEVRGHALDPFLAWEFTYKVQCLACPDGQQFEFGPKTVSGPNYTSGLNSIAISSDIDTSLPFIGDVHKIRIKSDIPLAAFQVGITNGGTEILGPVATVNGWNTFMVNYFDTNSYTLYFTGITSPSDIIIYTE